MAARWVVTLPPELSAPEQQVFAARAVAAGAAMLEVRSDLWASLSPALSAGPPLLIAERQRPLPQAWLAQASAIDRPLGAAGDASLRSLHAERPLTTDEALAAWPLALPPGVGIKHVEPLGPPHTAGRLLATQAALRARFGARVTVLAVGPLALPFRAVLAEGNALDYLALEAGWAAAPGQRLLADARRAAAAPAAARASGRLGLLGGNIGHSRSPRIHPPPFERLDLPADAPLTEMLAALHPFYRGLAVTSPFKIAAARAVASELPAINTLVRSAAGWTAANTDIAGATAALRQLLSAEGRRPSAGRDLTEAPWPTPHRDAAAGEGRAEGASFPEAPLVTVLGDGGATVAIREAATALGLGLRVLRRADFSGALEIAGAAMWSWPGDLAPPPGLRFRGARVGVLAYGSGARPIAAAIRRRGGVPVALGPRWFIAQARAQRTLWAGAP